MCVCVLFWSVFWNPVKTEAKAFDHHQLPCLREKMLPWRGAATRTGQKGTELKPVRKQNRSPSSLPSRGDIIMVKQTLTWSIIVWLCSDVVRVYVFFLLELLQFAKTETLVSGMLAPRPPVQNAWVQCWDVILRIRRICDMSLAISN